MKKFYSEVCLLEQAFIKDEEGLPDAVRYRHISVLLLNELKKIKQERKRQEELKIINQQIAAEQARIEKERAAMQNIETKKGENVDEDNNKSDKKTTKGSEDEETDEELKNG